MVERMLCKHNVIGSIPIISIYFIIKYKMKILYTKDKNRRNIFSLLEKKKIILNHIINNLKLSENIRNFAYLQLNHISKISTITKIKNRCVLSNRSRAVYRKFKLSRIFLKNYALQGLIMGVKKASW